MELHRLESLRTSAKARLASLLLQPMPTLAIYRSRHLGALSRTQRLVTDLTEAIDSLKADHGNN